MDMKFKEDFIAKWKKFFGEAELPIAFYYTDEEGQAELAKPGSVPRCVIAALMFVRNGRSLCFDSGSVGCFGGKRYLGFNDKLRPDFEYFLSGGIPGKFEGERYKKTPQIAAESLKFVPNFKAPAKFIMFKRWDMLEEADKPEVAVFFANLDVLSGLFTLANFDEAEPNGVFTPFGSGCSSLVQYPFLEKDAARPRAVIGLFDISARPFIATDCLSFSVPMSKFQRMVDNMEESFLTTNSWKAIQLRTEKEL